MGNEQPTTRVGEAKHARHFVHSPDLIDRSRTLSVARQLFVKGLGRLTSEAVYTISRPRGADEFILLLTEAGKGAFNMAGQMGQLRTGQALLIPPNTAHEFSAAGGPWTFYWIHFSGAAASEHTDRLCDLVLSMREVAPWIEQFETLFTTTANGYSDQELLEGSLELARLLAITTRLRQNENRTSRKTERRIQKTIDFMNARYREPIGLKELAREACLSIPQYGALFRARTGTSPARYLREIRLRRARERLGTSDDPISAIAAEVGFDDPYYFSRLFKRELGITPTEFRERSMI